MHGRVLISERTQQLLDMDNSYKKRTFAFLHTGPAQYVNRVGILDQAASCIAPWGDRALISGGKHALAAVEERLKLSLQKGGISWRKHLFTGECCSSNISKIKRKAKDLKANVVIGIGGGKSLDAAKAAAVELGIPVVCIPTIAATCAATTAQSVIYNGRGIFQEALILPRNPSLVLIDPGIIADAPEIYLKSGVLDSIAKWYEGRSIWPGIRNPDVQTSAAIALAKVLYKGLRRYAMEAVRLTIQHKVEDSLIQTLDRILLLTGLIQSLAKGTLFTAIAHPVHNGLTMLEGSRRILHGLKVGYGIIVQLCMEKCPDGEFEDVLSFFRGLGLEPSLKGLKLPSNRDAVRRVAEKAASDPGIGPLPYPVNKEAIASAMEYLEKKLGPCVSSGNAALQQA